MNIAITAAPVRKTIRVNAGQKRAFEVFTAGMGRWWPKSHTINTSPPKEVIVEPRAGGRWYERGEDGGECAWGHVLAWDPPSRVVLAWQISGKWKFDPELLTEVEVRFTAEGENATVVELEHRHLDRFGADAEAVRKSIDSPGGWGGILEHFAAAVAA
ncbi:MAG: SRPBCC family protein [Methylobacteriaceae bacterium]|nr:SRPBCC family protein [Methylobacteriaceae bacterium]